MSGWDQVRRLSLPAPWQEFWVDLYEDPPMGDWLDAQAAAVAAKSNPTPETIDAAVRRFGPFIAAHNITDRDGQPLAELSLHTLSAGLFAAILDTVQRALEGGGLPPRRARRERSRGPSSPRRR